MAKSLAPLPTALLRSSLRSISPAKIGKQLKVLEQKKTFGCDESENRAAKALPSKGILALSIILKSMLRLSPYPEQWKQAKITMIAKPSKLLTQLESYRPGIKGKSSILGLMLYTLYTMYAASPH